METRHSAAPWKAQRAFCNNGPDYWIVSQAGWRKPAVAEVANEHDAMLMAAAPELLASLSRCLCYLERMALDDTTIDRGILDDGAAAILKATGGRL